MPIRYFTLALFSFLPAFSVAQTPEAYLARLAELGTGARSEAAYQDFARLLPVLPDSVRARLFADETAQGLRPSAGEVLLTWWRSQDPLPSTAANERLNEHLARVDTALTRYGNSRTPTGYDDRGTVYVRFGTPEYRRVIEYRSLDEVPADFVGIVPVGDRPENETWVYTRVTGQPHFTFVKRNGVYQESSTVHLLPRALRSPPDYEALHPGEKQKTMAVWVWHEIFRELAFLHEDYGSRYDRLSEYVASDTGGRGRRSTPSESISSFVNGFRWEGIRMDRWIADEREKNAPPATSAVLRDTGTLPLAYRTARFLQPDGSVATLLYWSIAPDLLATHGMPLGEDGTPALLRTTALHQNATFETLEVTRDRTGLVYPPDEGSPPVWSVTAPGVLDTRYLTVQWHVADHRPQRPALAVEVTRVALADSAFADENRLALSDIVPVYAVDGLAFDEAGRPILRPYPFATLGTGTPLGLYVEVYHLVLDEDGQSRYAVEYLINRAEKPVDSLLGRIFNRAETSVTVAGTESAARGRTSFEFIELDRREWVGRAGRLTITIRVTDQRTGQLAERTVTFEVTG